MKRLLLALRTARVAVVLFISSSALAAQGGVTLSGRVTDASDGTALPAAILRLVDLHREARAHEDGTFTFGMVPAGTYQLTVHRIGYQSLTRSILVRVGMEAVVFAMRPSPLQLNATVVTGQVSERGASSAISPVNVLSDARLDRRLDGTVGSTVAGTPGVPATVEPTVPSSRRSSLASLSTFTGLIADDAPRSETCPVTTVAFNCSGEGRIAKTNGAIPSCTTTERVMDW